MIREEYFSLRGNDFVKQRFLEYKTLLHKPGSTGLLF